MVVVPTATNVPATADVLAVCIDCTSCVVITGVNVNKYLEKPLDSDLETSTVCVLVYTKCRTCVQGLDTYVSSYSTVNGVCVPNEASMGEIWMMHMSSSMSQSLHGHTIASKLCYDKVVETEFEFMNRDLIRRMTSVTSNLSSVIKLQSKSGVHSVHKLSYLRGGFF